MFNVPKTQSILGEITLYMAYAVKAYPLEESFKRPTSDSGRPIISRNGTTFTPLKERDT